MASEDPKRTFALDVVRTLQAAGHAALWAGGCVRDMLLGHAPEDYDVATDARPEQVRRLFGERRTLAIGAAFGVILVRGPRGRNAGNVEVATFRTEGAYLDGRRPQNVVFSTAEEDARRRDFTINGLFFDPVAGRLDDFVGGQEDLKRGIVRAIGNPIERFTEDKLRMLRAVRICARFAFQLDEATAHAARGMAPRILDVSQERIAQELRKMLVHERRAAAVELAHNLGLLLPIFPELEAHFLASACPLAVAVLNHLEAPTFELALAALLQSLGEEEATERALQRVHGVCRRLRLSNAECQRTAWLVAYRHEVAQTPTMTVARLKRMLAQPGIHELLALDRATCAARQSKPEAAQFCEEYLRALPREALAPAPFITGDDLRSAGMTPGPGFKSMLEELYDGQLEGRFATRDEALAHVRQLVTGRGGAG